MTVPTTLVIDATQQTLEVTTSRDAISLRGRDIETGTPTNGEVLTYSTSASEWIYQSVDENVDDRVAALIQDSAGGGLTWTYDDAAGTLTPAYVGDSTLVTTGALNSGSISSGFGAVNIGSSALTAGAASFTTLGATDDVTLAATKKLYLDGGNNTFISESAADNISFTTGGIQRWNINASGHLLAEGDNNYDIGASSANRPRDVYIAGTTTGAAASFTTISGSTSLALASGATVTGIDNGSLGTSATLLATQGAIKTYVDAQVTAQDLDIITSLGNIDIDLDSESLTLTGGTGLASSATGTTVTFAIDATVATLSGSQTLTNKTIAGGSNTLSAIANGSLTNSTVAYGGVTLALGASDSTPAFNLSDATAYTGDSALVTVGTISSGTWNGSVVTGAYIDATSSPLANTKIWIGSASNVAAEFALSGDATMTAGGVVTVSTAAACTGNAATATLASTVVVVDSTDATSNIAMFDSSTGSLAVKTDDGITYNSSTAALSATTFIGALTGLASTATLASTVVVVDSTDATSNIAMFDSPTGSLAVKTDSGITYNSSTAALSATTFVGALTGNSATATALQTARTIGGTSFDGTANIAVGLSATATALATARAINGTDFDGTAAITVTAAAGTVTGATLNSGVTASSLTSLGTLTSLSTGAITATGALTTIFQAVNSGNPEFKLGSSAAECLRIQTVYDSSAQTLNYVMFDTAAASVTGNKGEIRFQVDGDASNLSTVKFQDEGVDIAGNLALGTVFAVGSNPSGTGTIRLTKNFGIFTRNNANDANKACVSENTVTGNGTLDFGDNAQWDALRFHCSTANVMELTSSAINLNKAVTASSTSTLTGNVGIGQAAGGQALGVLFATGDEYISDMVHSDATTPFGIRMRFTGGAPNDATQEFLKFTDSSATRAVLRSNGGLANFQSNNADLSDERLKTIHNPTESKWDAHLALEVIDYHYNDSPDTRLLIGVGAHQAGECDERLCNTDGWEEDGEKYHGVYSKDLSFYTMKTVQECQARIVALETTIAELQGAA